ncbi:hypothetical protein ABVT39_019445 [Epinephelus coioides]
MTSKRLRTSGHRWRSILFTVGQVFSKVPVAGSDRQYALCTCKTNYTFSNATFLAITFFLIPSEKASSSLWAMQWIPSTYGLSARSFVTTPLFTPVITDVPSMVRATSLFFQSVLTSLSIILHTASAIFVASGFETAFTLTKSALTFSSLALTEMNNL